MRGRYSIIGLKPDLIWRCRGQRRRSTGAPASTPTRSSRPPSRRAGSAARAGRRVPDRAAAGAAADGGRPVRLSGLRHGPPDGAPAGQESGPARPARGDLPAADGDRDLRQHRGPGDRGDAGLADARRSMRRAAYGQACERLADVVADFDRSLPHRRDDGVDRAATCPSRPRTSRREQYHAMVEQAKEYIRAGDIFQVVPSQRFQLPFQLPPFALYRALRRLNPSPFLFFLDFGGFAAGRLEPGDPGAAARRQGDHPPDRRHPPARRHAGRRTRRWPPTCWPIPRSWPSI